jgi:hypothetical protein
VTARSLAVRDWPSCPVCDKTLTYRKLLAPDHPSTRNRLPRYCTPACRQAAYRRRQAGVAENTPRIYRNEDVLNPQAYRERILSVR